LFSTHGIALSASTVGHAGVPVLSRRMCSAIARSAWYSGARKTQGAPSTVSGTTTSSAISCLMATSITSAGICSSFTASGTNSAYGNPQCPCEDASASAYDTPAWARRGESSAMPIFWAMVSADRKPISRMSRAAPSARMTALVR